MNRIQLKQKYAGNRRKSLKTQPSNNILREMNTASKKQENGIKDPDKSK